MGNIELLLIALGLAMDAFAVAVCKGLAMKKFNIKKAVIIALWFGVFQGIMPIIGFGLGNVFESWINSVKYIIAFILLCFIGYSMLKEEEKEDETYIKDTILARDMFILAVATSIDALTIGVTFAFFKVNIILAAIIISSITFILSAIAVVIGSKFGEKCGKKAQAVGGILLILLGIQNLLEHFGTFL